MILQYRNGVIHTLYWLTAKVWQARDKGAEADPTGKCQYIEILCILHSRCKCEYNNGLSCLLLLCVL